MSSGIKVSKEGVNVETAVNKDLLVSSQFDTLKIFRTGELVLLCPTEDVPGNTNVYYTKTFNHNLGYIPAFLPLIYDTPAPVEDGPIIVGGEYIVNDLDDTPIPVTPGWGPTFTGEFVSVLVTSTQLILSVRRFWQDFFGGPPEEWAESTATLYYTIYYNKVNEEFNLL